MKPALSAFSRFAGDASDFGQTFLPLLFYRVFDWGVFFEDFFNFFFPTIKSSLYISTKLLNEFINFFLLFDQRTAGNVRDTLDPK